MKMVGKCTSTFSSEEMRRLSDAIETGNSEAVYDVFREAIVEAVGHLNSDGLTAAFAAVNGIRNVPQFRRDE